MQFSVLYIFWRNGKKIVNKKEQKDYLDLKLKFLKINLFFLDNSIIILIKLCIVILRFLMMTK